eukprot:g10043.t1
MRLLKSSRIIHKIEIPMAIPYQQIALIRFLLVLGLVCHWLASLWALTLQLADDESPKWIENIKENDRVDELPTYQIYLAAFYFCSYTMTSVGYGDVGPKNVMERTVCTMMILTAGLCWAYVLGEVCGIVTEMTFDSQRFRKRSFGWNGMHQLNCMMQHQDLPKALRLRLRSFFLQNRYQAFYLTQQELLKDRDRRPQLQSEVCTALHLPWIQKVSFLQQFMALIRAQESKGVHTGPYHACIADISRELKSVAYAQQESFENVQVLHILSKGLVALDNRIGHDGTVWGEDFVLSDLSLIRPVDAFALTYVEVMCLSRDGLLTVVERRKRTCPLLGRLVRRYCVRIAASRGVLAEARRRTRVTRLTKLRMARRSMAGNANAAALARPSPPSSPRMTLSESLTPIKQPELDKAAGEDDVPSLPSQVTHDELHSTSASTPFVPVILHYATAVNVTAADGSGEHRLLRRETTKFKLWEERGHSATGQQITPNFLPEVRQCNYSKAEQMHLEATHRRSDTQRGLKEVKEVMADQNVPLILLGGLALGHHSFCAAMVNDMDRLSEVEPMSRDGPMTAGCKLTVFLFAAHGKLPQHLAFEIQVLSSAPPPAVARLPGRFRSCAAVCGEHCEACTLAYASWSEMLSEDWAKAVWPRQ